MTEIYSEGENYPIILNFQNGSLQKINTEECKGGVYTNKSSKCSTKTVVVAIDGMIYAGTEYNNEYSRNVIIVKNRITKKVRIIEVGNAMLKAVTEMEQGIFDDTVDAPKIDVNEKFGSKRRKRMLEQSKRSAIDIEAMKEQLEKTVVEKHINVSEMNEHVANVSNTLDKYTPPINRDASNIKDIFNVKEFLTDEQIEILKVNANTILDSDAHELELTEYIAGHFEKLKESKSPQKNEIGALLLYADCIIRYLTDDYKKVSKGSYIVCSYSELINNFVLETFSMTSEKGRIRPQSLKDKSICFVVALLLLANNYLIPDVKILSKTLKITIIHLTKMTRVIGAHVVNDAIVLKLPLAQPLLAKSRRDRR